MDPAIALALWLAPPLPLASPPPGSPPLGSQPPGSRAIGSLPLRNPPRVNLAAGSLSLRNLAVGGLPPMGRVAEALPPLGRVAEALSRNGLVVASRAPRPRQAPVLPAPAPPGPGAAEPPTPPALTAQQSGDSNDRSRRFPLRRESGGTRGACAARLLAQLVPPDSQLDPGREPILGLIEGDSPEPAPLVMRWPGGEAIEPARRGASLRLVRFTGPLGAGLWESFPACEGSVEPLAPPARSLLVFAAGVGGDRASARDGGAQTALRALWNQCGQSVDTSAVLARWDFAHLAERLPANLPVICATRSPGSR